MDVFFGLLFLVGIVGLVSSFLMRKKKNFIGKNARVIMLISIAFVVIACIIAAVSSPETDPLGESPPAPESSMADGSTVSTETTTSSEVSDASSSLDNSYADVKDTPESSAVKEEADLSDGAGMQAEHTVLHGSLENWTETELDGKSILVIKVKIAPSYNNKATINQNYYNVENIIKEQGGRNFDEVQYWAVADMTSGEESKVISFTLNKETISAIDNSSIVANQMGNSVTDLWIHDSLK